MTRKNDYLKLKIEVLHHNHLYFDKNRPEITDDVYDRLLHQLTQIEHNHPTWVEPDSPTQRVGESTTSNFKSAQHRVPMMSMDNTYSDEELLRFNERVKKGLGSSSPYSVELKIDGVSISLTYLKGMLDRAVTRGDGQMGDDVTQNIKRVRSVPITLSAQDHLPHEIEIRGEVFIRRDDFQKLNQERQEDGLSVFANPRNATAGSLKLLEPDLVEKRSLQFLAHGVGFMSAPEKPKTVLSSQSELLKAYRRSGIPTVKESATCLDIADVLKVCHYWQEKRHTLPFDSDGMVVKVDSFSDQKRLGVTTKCPRYLIAYKFPAKKAQTRLLDIFCQVGRTGVLTPVAQLEPVKLSGSVVKRATLHNEDEIDRLGIRIGDFVWIEKSGEIIPQIVSVDIRKRGKNTKPFKMPSRCPDCKSEVRRESGEVASRCVNASCSAQIKGRVLHFASKKAMDIEGLGEALVVQLVDEGLVKRLSDLYFLKEAPLRDLDRMGSKSTLNLLAAIRSSRSKDLSKLIFGMGIRHVGVRSARIFAQVFRSMEALSQAKLAELEAIHEIGPVMAKSVHHFFNNVQNQKLISELSRANVNMEAEIRKGGGRLQGKTFVITGTLKKFSRDAISQRIIDQGGQVSSSVSQKTSFLVTGEKPGSKLNKAKKMGVRTLTEDEIESLL